MPIQVLFVGAHPDDIELGAGGLAYRMARDGHDVWFLVLTDDPDIAEVRRDEARAGAAALGVKPGQVLFGGFRDGYLEAGRGTTASLRDLFQSVGLSPSIVVAHTAGDSHPDHRAVNQLVRSTFRRSILAFYAIHISAELYNFSPRFYSELQGKVAEHKNHALDAHVSQKDRIGKADLNVFESRLSDASGLHQAEALEVEFQVDASRAALGALVSYNDSLFHSIWMPILGTEPLTLLYEVYDGSYPTTADEATGRDALRDSFNTRWFPFVGLGAPIMERFSNTPEAAHLFKESHMLLAGGPVSNLVYRNIFCRLAGIDWVVDYTLPDQEDVFVREKGSGRRFYGTVEGGVVQTDLSVLTIMRNPYNRNVWIISCAGVHSEGSRALLEFLALPERYEEHARVIIDLLRSGDGFQAIVQSGRSDRSLEILRTRATR